MLADAKQLFSCCCQSGHTLWLFPSGPTAFTLATGLIAVEQLELQLQGRWSTASSAHACICSHSTTEGGAAGKGSAFVSQVHITALVSSHPITLNELLYYYHPYNLNPHTKSFTQACSSNLLTLNRFYIVCMFLKHFTNDCSITLAVVKKTL